MADYYEILGVTKEATKEEIKSAFRQKARKLHPDVNKAPDAEERFKELGKAYETLSDDLRYDVKLKFEEAAFGINKEIKFDHLETCPDCHGTGAEAGTQKKTCPQCNGSGQVKTVTRTPLGNFAQITTCPHCKGKGQVIDKPCKTCKGHGQVNKEKKVEIKIPAGVDNMSKIRVSKEGDCGINGGPNGDLFVVIHVEPSNYYKRDGINVFTELEISPAQAVVGDIISIKTLDGEKEIQIPAGSQHGHLLKIKGAGIPIITRPSQRGDHIVVLKIKVPTKLNEEEKVLYQKLYEIQTGKKPQKSIMSKVKGVFK